MDILVRDEQSPYLSHEQSPDEKVAAEVWACLGRRRLSANKAAAALGWKQTYLSRRLTGVVSFSVADLYALAHLLRVKITQFFPEDHGINALYLGLAEAA